MSTANAKYAELFPPALGNEEESMLLIGRVGEPLEDPTGFVSNFGNYIPSGIKTLTVLGRKFTQNGGIIYDGGAGDLEDEQSYYSGVNLERATPECATPLEVATYTQASERMYVKMLENFLQDGMNEGWLGVARAQRRVVDARGNGRACHDNIEAFRPLWLQKFNTQDNAVARAVFLRFLQTRSFITGAGYVDYEGAHYAQKVQHLNELSGYGFKSTAYRNATEKDTGPRMEIRCNDINISPWAIQARIGGSALLFTLLQTPLLDKIANYTPMELTDTQQLENFRYFNDVAFDDDQGLLKFTPATVQALDFQERLYELMDEKLGKFVDLPEDYKRIIWEQRYYFEDFREVLHGNEPISVVADRSDMAAKFARILDLQEQAGELGLEQQFGGLVSMARDLRYDNITVDVDSMGDVRTTYGYGYRLRDKGQFRMTPKPDDVEHAMYYPPTTTRANIRGMLIRRGELQECSWSSVTYKGENSPYMTLDDVILKDRVVDVGPQKM